MKRFLRYLLHYVLFLIGSAFIQAQAQTAELSWVNPLTYTNQQPITGTITTTIYGMQQSASGSCSTAGMTQIATGISGTTYAVSTGLAYGQTWCFAVTTQVAGDPNSSAFSNIATLQLAFPTPSSATGVAAKQTS